MKPVKPVNVQPDFSEVEVISNIEKLVDYETPDQNEDSTYQLKKSRTRHQSKKPSHLESQSTNVLFSDHELGIKNLRSSHSSKKQKGIKRFKSQVELVHRDRGYSQESLFADKTDISKRFNLRYKRQDIVATSDEFTIQ